MDPSTVSRIISKVSRAIGGLFPQYIQMPENHAILHMQEMFYNISRFPRVIGVVDGTHIKIQSPGKYNPLQAKLRCTLQSFYRDLKAMQL